MRMLRIALLAALALTASPTFGETHAIPNDPRAAFDRFIDVFNALDWDSFRRCFAASASLFNPDIPDVISLHRLDGRTDIERSFRAVFDGANAADPSPHGPNIRPENVRLQQFADTAVVTFEFKRSGGSIGRRTIVLNKQNGAWLIVHIHASNVIPR